MSNRKPTPPDDFDFNAFLTGAPAVQKSAAPELQPEPEEKSPFLAHQDAELVTETVEKQESAKVRIQESAKRRKIQPAPPTDPEDGRVKSSLSLSAETNDRIDELKFRVRRMMTGKKSDVTKGKIIDYAIQRVFEEFEQNGRYSEIVRALEESAKS